MTLRRNGIRRSARRAMVLFRRMWEPVQTDTFDARYGTDTGGAEALWKLDVTSPMLASAIATNRFMTVISRTRCNTCRWTPRDSLSSILVAAKAALRIRARLPSNCRRRVRT